MSVPNLAATASSTSISKIRSFPRAQTIPTSMLTLIEGTSFTTKLHRADILESCPSASSMSDPARFFNAIRATQTRAVAMFSAVNCSRLSSTHSSNRSKLISPAARRSRLCNRGGIGATLLPSVRCRTGGGGRGGGTVSSGEQLRLRAADEDRLRLTTLLDAPDGPPPRVRLRERGRALGAVCGAPLAVLARCCTEDIAKGGGGGGGSGEGEEA
mmetsp:Transcript_60347/g.158164  ORF Transcript_60347/g.158164 Transcript_60347/m.158164 type:complete len:214 (+) Transcript_60347:383-1024(+)